MLVLERKEDQKVLIYTSDGVVEVLVSNFINGRVTLGFKAPESVRILREEIATHAPVYFPDKH